MTTERKRIGRRTLLRRYAAGERDFSNIDFGETILSDVDLTGINLSGSIFLGIDLTGINLSHANLSGVKFLAVNFTGASLSGANFSEAELIGCQCVGTDFSHANFDRAILATNVVEGANMFPIEMDNAISISTTSNIHIIKSKMVCGQCPPYYLTIYKKGSILVRIDPFCWERAA